MATEVRAGKSKILKKRREMHEAPGGTYQGREKVVRRSQAAGLEPAAGGANRRPSGRLPRPAPGRERWPPPRSAPAAAAPPGSVGQGRWQRGPCSGPSGGAAGWSRCRRCAVVLRGRGNPSRCAPEGSVLGPLSRREARRGCPSPSTLSPLPDQPRKRWSRPPPGRAARGMRPLRPGAFIAGNR